ncbi:MAG TPA: cyclic nucleotide-binding domain-containing protein [Anaerolineales bacterium]|jgi:flavin-dependent dehydrogenase
MDDRILNRLLSRIQKKNASSLLLDHGSRVAVIGGGPAGSFFSYFLLDMVERIGLKIHVDIYEPRDFDVPGPAGCNMCGGVIYESLVQSLAVEGINLPPTIVQRGIVCNMLHLDVGSAQIQTPRNEKRIATTFRGAGPRGLMEFKSASLDGYLMQASVAKGARHIRGRVAEVRWLPDAHTAKPEDRLVQIKTQNGVFQTYELLAVTPGVNTAVLELFRDLDFGYEPPQTTKLLVREYHLGQEVVSKYVGPIFHAFLLDIPGLDYGAIIPKGNYVTICLLSSHGNLGTNTMETFLNEPAVRSALPPNFSSLQFSCHCGPRINIAGSAQPFGDRIVFIGDSGVSRLYKDGLGAAYRAAKIAATTAVFHGISSSDFKKHYLPFCRKLEVDNRIGKFLFRIVGQIQKMRFARRTILHMVSTEEQGKAKAERGMSALMWDMLTGGAPYREVLMHALYPSFWTSLLWNALVSLLFPNGNEQSADKPIPAISQATSDPRGSDVNTMSLGELGKVYQDGEIIVRQGELGDCMYVVQEGQVEVLIESEDHKVQLNILGKNEYFGEMAIFDHEIRSATVRALGFARILTVDHKNILRRIHEDPSLAYHLLQVMSDHVRRLSEEVAELKRYHDRDVPVSRSANGPKV